MALIMVEGDNISKGTVLAEGKNIFKDSVIGEAVHSNHCDISKVEADEDS
ncbi:hypothetical protein HPDP_00462 [Candidatus Hepatincola sp. Pdp]